MFNQQSTWKLSVSFVTCSYVSPPLLGPRLGNINSPFSLFPLFVIPLLLYKYTIVYSFILCKQPNYYQNSLFPNCSLPWGRVGYEHVQLQWELLRLCLNRWIARHFACCPLKVAAGLLHLAIQCGLRAIVTVSSGENHWIGGILWFNCLCSLAGNWRWGCGIWWSTAEGNVLIGWSKSARVVITMVFSLYPVCISFMHIILIHDSYITVWLDHK